MATPVWPFLNTPDNGDFNNTWDVPVNENFNLIASGMSSGVYHTQDGDVGIGTETPASKLEVNGSGGISFHGADSSFITSNGDKAFIYQSADGGSYPFDDFGNLIIQSRIHSSDSGKRRDIVFITSDTATPQVRGVIKASGNVGIGTTDPTALLHINNTITSGADAAFRISSNDTSELALVADLDGDDAGPTTWRILANREGDLRFFDNEESVSRLSIDQTGKVGIGTVLPITLLDVSGVITGATKNFKIDHPVDPDKYLIHSCVEGPEYAVFYRGQTQLSNGVKTVQLPSYYSKLVKNKSETIQLTCLGGYSPIYCTAVTVGATFKIKTDSGNMSQKVYWEVKGIRKDINPLVSEPNKSTAEEDLATTDAMRQKIIDKKIEIAAIKAAEAAASGVV